MRFCQTYCVTLINYHLLMIYIYIYIYTHTHTYIKTHFLEFSSFNHPPNQIYIYVKIILINYHVLMGKMNLLSFINYLGNI